MQPRIIANHFGHVRAESSEGRWWDAGVAAIFGISSAMGRRNTRSNKKARARGRFPAKPPEPAAERTAKWSQPGMTMAD